MPANPQPSPLAVAALALIHRHVTPSDLTLRFGAAGAVVQEGTAEELLDELSGLGLARVVQGADRHGEFFPTPLGERLLRV
ncbi:MAG: hypothetical protein ACRDGI_03685, partial [Candidatus Limnocylindrales bacterium]